MTRLEARKKLLQSIGACFLAFVMILTNVLGAVEVYAAAVKEPTVNPVFYDATTISGGNLAKARVNKKLVIATVHVKLTDKNGTEKATLSDSPTSGTTWKVKLPEGKKVEEGDTVTVYQQIGEDKSPEVTEKAKPSKASTVTLTMPSGEIWIEQYVANIVNADEKAEALDLLKKANPDIAKDIKSVEFKITGVDSKTASYIVTYTDDSKSEEIKAPDLTVKKVTETSRGTTIDDITIVDNVIKGKLKGEGPFTDIKVQIVVKLSDAGKGSFCNEKGCTVDKNSSNPVDATVNGETGEFSYTINPNNPTEKIELGNVVGVSVKEKNKFKSCSQTTVIAPKPKKTDVKDPKKLTGDDKEKIVNAIKKAYIAPDGTSKLPDGTGDKSGTPAFIEFDKDGNVTIISPNDVEATWDSNYNPVYVKNDDGSYKLKEGAKPTTILAKDLVKNIKPEAPAVVLSKDKKNITITPNEKDTDAKTITVSYKDKDGKDQTTTATKADDGTWSIDGEGTVKNGVITLPKDKVKGGTDVTAKVTDKGGIADDDKTPLTSDPGTLKIEETKADKVEALGGLDPVEMKKWVGDEVNWKDGIKAKDSTKETEVNKLLEGAKFEDVTEEKRSTSKEGDFKGKVKVKFDDESEIIVEKQMLYVSNNVTSMERKDKVPTDALDVEFKLGEGTKVDNVGSGAVEGNKDTPTLYQKYKVKPNTNLKTYKLPTINQSVVDSIKLSAQEGYVEPVWNTEDFTATKTNKTFTATATKAYNVTLEANGGDGNMAGAQVKENGTYKLPDNAFTPPNENQEFGGWLVDGATTITEPGTDITITKDTVIKASWKPIEFKAKFLPGEGATGSMEEKTVTKGSEFELPTPTFKAPTDKVFAGWKVNNEDGVKQAKDKIKISGDVTLTATWKDIEYKVTFNGTDGKGSMPEKLVKKGDKYTLPENGFEAPKDKVFDGWMVGTEKKSAGDPITINGDTEVKAVWKDIEYKVTFNGTEGTGTMPEKLVKKGEEYTLPDNGFTAPEGKEFDGWMVGTEKKSAGDTITVNGDTEVKAVWKDIEHKVTFNGTEGSGKMDEKLVKHGKEYTLPDNGFEAPKDKVFDGWMVGTEKKTVGDKITVNANTTVKAIWKDIEYKVTFDGNTGTGAMTEATVKKGNQYELPANGFTAPEGKEFDGWMVGTEKKTVGDKITVNANTTVKAIWKDIEYKVTFDGNTGTGTMTEATVKKGNQYELPANGFTAPEGKEFKCWQVGTEEKNPNDTITINANTEVKAIWKDKTSAVENFTVTFNGNGGTKTMEAQTVKKGNQFTLPANGFTAPEGKEFKCWQVGTEEKNPNDTITINANTEVKAIWKDKTPVVENVTVTFNANGGSKGMDSKTVAKGSAFTLPANGFTAPEGKEFAGWEVDGQTKKAGESIQINKNTVVKAIWKAKTVEPSKPDAPAADRGNYLILEKVEPTEPKVDWEIGRHYKYLYGYPDGSVHPEGQITRAEAAGLIARLAELDLSNKAKPNFKDTPSRWYNSAINVMVAKDLMFADKNGNFRPNEPITRGEFARALYYIDKKNNVVAPFADVKGHEFEAAINQAYGNGRIAGYPDGSFRPDAYIQRAEAARMLNQYADRSVSLEGMAGVKKDVIRFTDINESHWAYYEVMEAANTHDYRRAKGTLPETWVRIIQKDDRVAR